MRSKERRGRGLKNKKREGEGGEVCTAWIGKKDGMEERKGGGGESKRIAGILLRGL